MATNPFTEHPNSAGETYGEHVRVAASVSRQLFGAAIAALVHAFLPMFHKTTASDRINCLHQCIEQGHRDRITLVKAATPPPADPAVLHAS
jgi:hypothetical protein